MNYNTKKVLFKIAKLLEPIMNFEKETFFGEGTMGIALKSKDNRVIKISNSLSEVRVFNNILGEKTKHFPFVYDVKLIKYQGNKYGVILKEFIPQDKGIYKIVPRDTIKNYFNLKSTEPLVYFLYKKALNLDLKEDEKYPDNLNWLIKQLNSIVKEARKYDLTSLDFNEDNIVVKNNTIVWFDVDHRTYNPYKKEDIVLEERKKLDKKDLDNIKKITEKVTIKLNIEDYKLIDFGFFGAAFKIDDNKILKITTDSTEIINAYHIKNYKSSFFPEIYDLKRVSVKDREYGLLITEYIPNSISDYEYSTADMYLQNILEERFPGMEMEEDMLYIITYNFEIATEIYDDIKGIKLLKQVYDLSELNYLHSDIVVDDLHKENLRRRDDGSLVYIDLGFTMKMNKKYDFLENKIEIIDL